MTLLQKKIAHLDGENHTSRRRMKELERELDICRQDVERQREQVLWREEQLVKQQRADTITAKSKGKARAVDDTKEEQKRYKQAVEEKKGAPIYSVHPPWNSSHRYNSLRIPHCHSPISYGPTHFRALIT